MHSSSGVAAEQAAECQEMLTELQEFAAHQQMEITELQQRVHVRTPNFAPRYIDAYTITKSPLTALLVKVTGLALASPLHRPSANFHS